MVTTSLAKRMRKLRSLLDIRLGPGAALLSPTTTRLHLNFARKINEGHRGPRKFWHHYLPRLKYHNPGVPMSVERTEEQGGPATLVVSFASASAASAASTQAKSSSSGGAGERGAEATKKIINMKHRKEDEILDELMKVCSGRQVIATPAEEQQLRELKSESIRAEGDAVRQRKVLKDRKKQQQILQQAKQSMDTQ